MAFSNNLRPDRMPGLITGNPLNGLCEKVCIQTKKVFDACVKQETLTGQTVTLTNITPQGLVEPYTFVSAKSTSSNGLITNMTIDKLTDRSGCARIRCDVIIPVEVVFVDANGTEGKGNGTITVNKDVVLHIAQPSVMPYEIEAVVNLVSPEGVYSGSNAFSITSCTTVIMKVVMDVELLVPSYGYCFIPPCQEFKEEVCDSFFDLPLFPSDMTCR